MGTNDLQFRLTITCENAAFEDSPEAEIARILRRTADSMEDGFDFGFCRNLLDADGNIVGTAALKTVEEHDGGRVHDRKARKLAALVLGAFLAFGASGCQERPRDLVTVAQYPDGSFSTTRRASWPPDARMADAFPATKGDPR